MLDEILSRLPDRAVGRATTPCSPPGWARGDLRGAGHRVVPGDRPAPRRRRDLPEGVQAPRRAAPLRATSPTRSGRFEKAWLATLERGVAAEVFRADLDIRPHLPLRARHRVGRRVLVPAGRPAQPGGDRPAVPVDGPGRDRRTRSLTPDRGVRDGRGLHRRSGPHARRPARRRPGRRPPRRPRRARADGADRRAPASTRPPSRTSSSAASTRSARRPATSPAPAGWPPGCPRRCPAPPSTGSAARRSRPCTSPRRRVMSRHRRTSSSPAACRT